MLIELPPDWKKHLGPKAFSLIYGQYPDIQDTLNKAQTEYDYWEKFKHYPLPPDVKPEEAWAALKLKRVSSAVPAPIFSIAGEPFRYCLTNTILQRLNRIDTQCAGSIRGDGFTKPDRQEEARLIISGLAEEAIASSQIEGASTSRKVAKEMITAGRKPQTKDEQMIMNNFAVMEKLDDWKDLPLSLTLLLDIQKRITADTLEDAADSGRLRNDADGIRIFHRPTGELLFTPPDEAAMKRELGRLIEYANSDGGEFVHPVVKACILHFWMAYLHPFVDGNGRTARTIFYWYLLKRDYWLFKYLSVSRVIKQQRKRYDWSFLQAEIDDNDLTYSLNYLTGVIAAAIDDFLAHLKKKRAEAAEIRKVAERIVKYNERQTELLTHLVKEGGRKVEIAAYQAGNSVTYETARRDLLGLAADGLFRQETEGRKFVFFPDLDAIRNLLRR